MGLLNRFRKAWNAFVGLDPFIRDEYNNYSRYVDLGPGSQYHPEKTLFYHKNDQSIVGAIYNRIAIDCSSIVLNHVRLDKQGRFEEIITSGLNECLSLSTNLDQTAKMFIRDLVISMLEEGNVAIVPIDTENTPDSTESYDIYTMRVGKIIEWYPQHVKVEVYNELTGHKVELIKPKDQIAIIENPLYAIMNDRHSMLQRLANKLSLLDIVEEKTGSDRLDLIVQLPYVIKTEERRKQAERRKTDIEDQLSNSKFGIAYTDGTEKITQLNRPVENNILKSVEYYTSMVYSQLGMTDEIMKGTADEKAMLNYINRTVQPIMDTIVDEMKRKFLTKTARTQKQSIMYFNEPFKLVPIQNIADIADKFTRNEIMSSNEMRQIVGLKPVKDPKADELRNKNLNEQEGQGFANTTKVNNSEHNIVPEVSTDKQGD